MKEITKTAWSKVIEIACAITNASEAGDQVLVEVHTGRLMATLDELEAEFGAHPEFYDTRGDYLDDPKERMRFYRKALKLAEEKGDEEVRGEVLESISELLGELGEGG